MAQRGVDVDVHHIHEVDPHRVRLRRTCTSLRWPHGPAPRPAPSLPQEAEPAGWDAYAVLTTEVAPRPDKLSGRLPREVWRARCRRRVRPIMDELLQGHGMVNLAEDLPCVCHRAEGAAKGRVAGQGQRVRGPHPSQQLIRSKPRTRARSCASTMHDGRRHGRCGKPGWEARRAGPYHAGHRHRRRPGVLGRPRCPLAPCWCSAPPLGRFAGGGQQVAGLNGAARPVRRRRPRLRLSQQDGDAAHEAGWRCWSLPCASRSLRQGERLPVPLRTRRATRRLTACPTAAPGWPARGPLQLLLECSNDAKHFEIRCHPRTRLGHCRAYARESSHGTLPG